MPKYIDEEGNEIEIDVTIDELKAAAEEKARMEVELNQTKDQLAKSANKDMNWRRLNTIADEELKKLSSKEIELMKRQEDLEDQHKTWQKQQLDSHKANALSRFGVDDDEARAKVLANYERIKDDATTEDQIMAKMRDAVTITTGNSPTSRMNPMFSGNAPMGTAHVAQRDGKINGDVADLAKKFGISTDEIKKYS